MRTRGVQLNAAVMAGARCLLLLLPQVRQVTPAIPSSSTSTDPDEEWRRRRRR